MIKKDVIIVGGGPAGASCALRLRQNNFDCLILDRQGFPRKKVCAGWITPEVLKYLEITEEKYPYGLTRFTSFQITTPVFQIKIPVTQFAIRRIEFDNWLLQKSGTSFTRHQVKLIKKIGNQFIIDDKWVCKYLVGAGGTNCPVYKTFFRKTNPRIENSLIVAMEEEFTYADTDDLCRLWFFENHLPGYAWYVPKAGGVVNIGIGGNIAKLNERGSSLKTQWEYFTNKLEQRGLIKSHSFKPEGHSYYLRQKHLSPRIGNALIVGDAVGLATLDMGEGIRSSVYSGMLAADAIIHDTDYSLKSIPKYSFQSLIFSRFRKNSSA